MRNVRARTALGVTAGEWGSMTARMSSDSREAARSRRSCSSASWRTRNDSVSPPGQCSAVRRASRSSRMSGDSPGSSWKRPVSPWVTPLWATRALPSSVGGPVDLRALSRFEAIWRSVPLVPSFLPGPYAPWRAGYCMGLGVTLFSELAGGRNNRLHTIDNKIFIVISDLFHVW